MSIVTHPTEWLDPLTSFDDERVRPHVNLSDRVTEIIRQGDRRVRRREQVLAVTVAVLVGLGCWSMKLTVPSRAVPAGEPALADAERQLDQEIRQRAVQLAVLDQVWQEYERSVTGAVDYRDYVGRQLDHQLAAGLAARTILHDAQTEPTKEKQQEKLRLILQYFEDTDAGQEAVALIARS